MPKRYWAFTGLKFEYEGYNVTEIYKSAWQAITDRNYFANEIRYIHAYVGDAQATIAWWVATYEAEKKYSLTGLNVALKIVWRLVPKPGTSGENAPKVPYGKATVEMSGFVVTDYLNIWGKSPILKPLFDIRDRMFYKRRTDVLKKKVRQDAEDIIKDLNELVSFLPKLMG